MGYLKALSNRFKQFNQRSAVMALSMSLVLGVGSLTALAFERDDYTMKGSVVSGLKYADLNDAQNPSLLRFVAFGDAGVHRSTQFRVIEQMELLQKTQPFKLGLMLGDNIYPNGDFKTYGAKRFSQPYRDLRGMGVKFLPVLGNHDLMDKGYPKPLLDFLGMPASYYDYTVGAVHFFALDTNNFDKEQQEWLRQRLESSAAPWKVVYGHHPVLSSGEHGDTPVLAYALKPILEQGGAQVYLSAHDHDYERFKPLEGVHYMVSGGGGARIRDFSSTPKPESLVRIQAHHFIAFEASPQSLTFQVIDDKGNVLDKGNISPVPTVGRINPSLTNPSAIQTTPPAGAQPNALFPSNQGMSRSSLRLPMGTPASKTTIDVTPNAKPANARQPFNP